MGGERVELGVHDYMLDLVLAECDTLAARTLWSSDKAAVALPIIPVFCEKDRRSLQINARE